MNYCFRKKYQDLEKGRWFFTVWVSLPDEARNIIRENLEPLIHYCEWISTLAGNHSKDIPHISLRYLGFSDELTHVEVKKDKPLFEKAIKGVSDLEIELGPMNLWTREREGKVTVARINWQILEPKPFIDLHKALLSVPNYYIFENLENENFNPHISLGEIDMSNYSNYEHVKNYLDRKEFKTNKFILKDFALNLTSPEHTEVVPLSV